MGDCFVDCFLDVVLAAATLPCPPGTETGVAWPGGCVTAWLSFGTPTCLAFGVATWIFCASVLRDRREPREGTQDHRARRRRLL